MDQHGNNADSTYGAPGNPTTYIGWNPAYPVRSSTVTADTPDFITQWHKDSKILYDATGVLASANQNDSALYGVTTIDLTPIGLIADGKGHAAAGTSLGIFSTGEDGTQVEIYGTARYGFNWQTGELAFKSWKPLTDANGNEIQSKIVDLPAGKKWSDGYFNCVITYHGLHWPDVRAYIKERDKDWKSGTFAIGNETLYTMVKAVKAG